MMLPPSSWAPRWRIETAARVLPEVRIGRRLLVGFCASASVVRSFPSRTAYVWLFALTST
jgi:hypothetical protein